MAAATGLRASAGERFIFSQLALIGQHVNVRTKDGSVYAGVFHSSDSRPGGLAVTLRFATLQTAGTAALTMEPDNALLVRPEDFVEMWAPRVDLAALVSAGGDSFKTDTDISGQLNSSARSLTRVGADWLTPEAGVLGALGDDDDDGTFDQFEANRRLTGHTATFDESAYTTRLDSRTFSSRDRAEADRVAKDIMRSGTSNVHLAEERGQGVRGNLDEEARYSGVLTGGASSLQVRNAAPAPAPAAAPGEAGAYRPPHKGGKGLDFRAAVAGKPKAKPDRAADIASLKDFSAGVGQRIDSKKSEKRSQKAAAASAPAPAPAPVPAPAPAPAPAAEAPKKAKKVLKFNVNAASWDGGVSAPAPAPVAMPMPGAVPYGHFVPGAAPGFMPAPMMAPGYPPMAGGFPAGGFPPQAMPFAPPPGVPGFMPQPGGNPAAMAAQAAITKGAAPRK